MCIWWKTWCPADEARTCSASWRAECAEGGLAAAWPQTEELWNPLLVKAPWNSWHQEAAVMCPQMSCNRNCWSTAKNHEYREKTWTDIGGHSGIFPQQDWSWRGWTSWFHSCEELQQLLCYSWAKPARKVCTHTQGFTELLHSASLPLKSTFQLQDYLLCYICKSLYGVMWKQQKAIFSI